MTHGALSIYLFITPTDLDAELIETTHHVEEVSLVCVIQICADEGVRIGQTVPNGSLAERVDVVLGDERYMSVALVLDCWQTARLSELIDEPVPINRVPRLNICSKTTNYNLAHVLGL